MFRHFSLWGCLAITLGIWWTCWLVVRGRGQWAEAPRGGDGGEDLAISDLNQTNSVRLPSAFSYCQVCGSCFNQPLQMETGREERRNQNISCQTGVWSLSFTIKISTQSVLLCQSKPPSTGQLGQGAPSSVKMKLKASLRFDTSSPLPHHTVSISPCAPARIPFPSLQPPIVFWAQQ